MSPIDDHYPQSCAFCAISKTYAPDSSSPVPSAPNPEFLDPQCHLILSTKLVLAFLDIMPIAPGHILLTTRKHYQKLSDIPNTSGSSQDWVRRREAAEAREAARELGEWLPVISRALCKVTGIEDWNIVQNNGERAAQVVPHVHFHLIPRYQERNGSINHGMLKSWTMFGRGSREDLDDDEAALLAGLLREAIKKEIEGWHGQSKL
ncbi:related to histidine triad protein [Ramularia collo-cygni]|uniref:Related to histidine triad protein n=1 Tax=Ramularia collo-cygni TaxID=112498 RepID=A0A2D3UUK0_9PEZI|nr:related to histidine triad protein [Ramularia collo-cygni]CZT16630.1 related to histidine triad protein [Ramularia collo-cygni]